MVQNLFILIFSIFFLGILGILLNRHNIIILLLSFEIIYLSSNLIFALFSYQTGNLLGVFYIIFSLAIVGAEACISLSILSFFFNTTKEVNLIELDLTKY